MTLGAPWGLLAAALAGPLTLWYVLRARRPRVEVASTFLWRRTDRSVAAAVPWQRFRPDRTYWLVLAAILAGAVALARPMVPVAADLGDHTIVLLDTSASMQADEQGPSRLELARRAVREMVSRMSGAQTVSVIEAGPRARVLIAAAGDATAARRAVDMARPSAGAADLADAFTLAASLQRPGEHTVTHLFTDGPVPEGLDALAPPGLVINGVGSDRPNLAVTRLQALPGGAGGAQAFVQVRNLGQLPARAVLTLTVDDREVARRDLELGPRGSEDLVVDVGTHAASDRGVVRATVTPGGEDAGGDTSRDALAVDDSAVAVLAGARRVRALVVGPGNVFVEAALEAVDGVEVATAESLPEDLADVDLLVVDGGVAPVRPTVPTLYIAPRRPPADVSVGAPIELPALTFQDPGAELLTDVDLSGVAIASAQRVDAPTLQTVASSPQGPLLLTGRLAGTPVVYVAFALGDSNLPLQVAWPVLVANSVAWLAGPPTTPPLVAGSVADVPVPPGATGVTVTPPGGEPQRLDPVRAQVRVDTSGLWQVAYEGEDAHSALLAVNADPHEADLARGRPKPLEAGGRDGAPVATATSDGRRDIGAALLVVPLVALVAEALWPRRRRRRRGRPRWRGPRWRRARRSP